MVYVTPRPSIHQRLKEGNGAALLPITLRQNKGLATSLIHCILKVIEKVYVYLPPLAPHRGECARFARALRSSYERLSI